MSEFSLDEVAWTIGVGFAELIASWLGLRHGSTQREETAERVPVLAIAGGIYQTGQASLGQQSLVDMIEAARKFTAAIDGFAKVANDLTDSIAHFDETTEREAKDRTAA